MLNDGISNATVTQRRMQCIKDYSKYKWKNRIRTGRAPIQGAESPDDAEMNGKTCQNSLVSQPVFKMGTTQTQARSAVIWSS